MKLDTTESVIEHLNSTFGIEEVKKIREVIGDVNPQLHPFVQMANVCLDIVEHDAFSDEIKEEAKEAIQQLFKSFTTYGYKICKNM